MKKSDFKPASAIQDLQYFGEFGGVNPSVNDSSTYTFLEAETMEDVFEGTKEGCFLYSRHWNPTNKYLADALAKMENTEAAAVTASGMAAISATIMQICSAGDHIVASRTIYGGTYALLKNFLNRFGIESSFVNTSDTNEISKAIRKNTKMVYCETLSNPLLEVSNIFEISKITKANDCLLVVDNTFSPLIFSPANMGADIVIHSLTKYINGMSDCVGGCICASEEFINSLYDVNSGAAMLLGPVLESSRSASILKNMHTLAIRMHKHSENALFLSENLLKSNYKIIYPGLENHKDHIIFNKLKNSNYAYGGLFVIDMETKEKANILMKLMQDNNIGYLAVSLGWHKTLFSAPGGSTSSEIPEDERQQMGLTDGLIRISIGLDDDIERTYCRILECLKKIDSIWEFEDEIAERN